MANALNCSRPGVADEADVEHELVPLVLVAVVDDPGEAAYLVAVDVEGHRPVRQLRLGDDVGQDVVVPVVTDALVPGQVTPHRRALLKGLFLNRERANHF